MQKLMENIGKFGGKEYNLMILEQLVQGHCFTDTTASVTDFMEPSRKRKRVTKRTLPDNKHNKTNPIQSSNLTTAQFMSQPLAAFINDNDETNFDIAKSIATYFDNRDTGKYAAIVSDIPIKCACSYSEGKYRSVDKCRGKYIQVWKQSGQNFNLNHSPKESIVASCVKGIIGDHQDDIAAIQSGLDEVFGKSWAVFAGKEQFGIYCSYRKYLFNGEISGKRWVIWRQAPA